MALVYAAPGADARADPRARPRSSSSRATCSTGGTPHRARACAPASPTTCSGCPTPPPLLAATGDDDAARRGGALPRRRRAARARRGRRLLHAAALADETAARSTSTALPRPRRLRSRSGAHGLPLMGTGDWNDGMNRVGDEGKGESVWLGWFLAAILDAVRRICAERAATASAPARYRALRARRSRAALDGDGWDGDWYRRAYFDDGTPLGSASNDECRIDSIAQSWAVLSGGATPDRAAQAMDAVDAAPRRRRAAGIDPPVHAALRLTAHDPGYIKGYLPGMRENGGQYTHGALWAVRAFAEAGRARPRVRAAAMILPGQPRAHAGGRPTATRSSPTWSPPTSTRSRRTSGAAAGPGTPARPAGCSASPSSPSLGPAPRGRRALPHAAHPGRLAGLHAPLPDRHTRHGLRRSRVERDGPGGATAAEADGQTLDGRGRHGAHPARLGRAEHAVTVRLGRT